MQKSLLWPTIALLTPDTKKKPIFIGGMVLVSIRWKHEFKSTDSADIGTREQHNNIS